MFDPQPTLRRITRRRALRDGLAAAGALVVPQLVLRGLFAADQPPARETSVIFVVLTGGMSQLDSFDPKPDAPAEYRGEFGTTATNVPGVRFCEHLPQLAQSFHRFSLLRAVSHEIDQHLLGRRLVETGERFATSQTPTLGAVVNWRLGWQVPPVYVAIPNRETAAGLLGPSCEPYSVLGDGGQLLAEAAGSPELQRLPDRLSLLRSLDHAFAQRGINAPSMTARNKAYEQSVELLRADRVRHAAQLDREPDHVRDRYGRFDWGDYLLLARRFVEAGSRFVTVFLPGWDTHTANFKTMKRLLPKLDHALAALFADLEDCGLLATTHVVAIGEFGRTPRVNVTAGRDHWPRAMSVLWAGGSTPGGRVIGSTDHHGKDPQEGQVSPEDIAFTLLVRFGIKPDLKLMPNGGRLLPTGRLIDA